MTIRWQVEDGYVNNRPHGTTVNDSELANCGSVEEAMTLIEEAITSDFESKVSWCFARHSQVQEKLKELLADAGGVR